ncbi:uncharacterized protein BKA55DRAFT_262193 [Fusarium redolens]|uniref:Ubiquitin-like protease family profile domain-containing protein n=1 Tax=Fusarium redolens TaxID=48865 RepID=A0A9P9FYW9_FUSRE|nr:uncharacterized protein BKA55DRAFT_262193 [Fusarium redolens]KAH7208443.1 hypothetical protein BKA55DRAFT_262193 [Fusarium redolens]
MRAQKTRRTAPKDQGHQPSRPVNAEDATTDDVEKPSAESWDSDSTDEARSSDLHKKPTTWKRRRTDEEKQPGWWPQQYAPRNKNNRTLLAGMRRMIRIYKEAGRDPRDMWDENSKDGCMVKAAKQTRFGRLTAAVFQTVKPPFPITNPNKKGAVGAAKRQAMLEDRSVAESNYSPSYQDESDDNVDPRSPSSVIDVDDDAASFQAEILADSVRGTIARLNDDSMLRSDDISRCTKLLDLTDEWHIFDPGYPSEGSVLQRLETRANNFVFFLIAKCHWSLCHLERKSGQLNHFNSMRHTEMPVSGLVSWVSEHPSIKPACSVTIHEKDCPQQDDGFNCGIFALAFLQSLVNGEEIPAQVNARELRTFFATHIEATGPSEREIPVQKLSSPNRQISLEQINPVTRSVSLPADSSIPSSFLTESHKFLKTWKKEKSRLATATTTFEQKAMELSTLEENLTFYQQRLQNGKETVQELQEQIKESENTEILHKDIQDLIAKLPPAEGNNFQSKWLTKLRSSAEITNDLMLAESKSLPKKLSDAEREYDETRAKITQLEKQIQLHRKGLEVIGKEIEKTKQDLTYVSEECAQIGRL